MRVFLWKGMMVSGIAGIVLSCTGCEGLRINQDPNTPLPPAVEDRFERDRKGKETLKSADDFSVRRAVEQRQVRDPFFWKPHRRP